MGCVISTFSIANDQDLWGFVIDLKLFRDKIGHIAVGDEVQKVKFCCLSRQVPIAFQAVLGYRADGAAGTVLENNTGNFPASLFDVFYLLNGLEANPVDHGLASD